MQTTAKIIYDNTCVVCRYFMNLVKAKVGTDRAQYIPASGTAADFEYVSLNGKRYSGVNAIEQMSKDFPAIKDYMYVLPAKYKTFGLKVGYKIGSVVRKAIGTVYKGCNCGKH